MSYEKSYNAINGYLIVLVLLGLIVVAVYLLLRTHIYGLILIFILILLTLAGFVILNPNEACVLTLFGDYKGSILNNGFWWVNPLMVKRKISLRARNFNSDTIKVNDKIGNPIMIGAVVVWRVKDTYKAVFEVDNYEHFVVVQTDAAIRKLAGMYPYDNIEDEHTGLTLRESNEEISKQLETEISKRLAIAGIEVLEARINYLAYATEIAGAMLKRQQAVAIIAARKKIVEGAVSMIEMALEKLDKENIVKLDEKSKAQMVANLMVVLTSEKEVTPVINTASTQ